MLFFVTSAGAQSEKSCDPKDCNVKCCSPKTCTELVSAGICTPEQVAACKATSTTKVASMVKVKGEIKSEAAACAKPTSSATCSKADAKAKACKPASSKLVSVEKLKNQDIKPVTKDQ